MEVSNHMIRSRLHEKFAALCVLLAIGFVASTPAQAALHFVPDTIHFIHDTTLRPGTSNFDLTLSSDALDDVGFDYFTVALTYLPAVQTSLPAGQTLTTGAFVSGKSVVGLEGLPLTVPGYLVGGSNANLPVDLANEKITVDYIGEDLGGRIPGAPLLKFTFQVADPSASFSQQITATLERFDLNDVLQGEALSVTANIQTQAIPEPASWLLLVAGVGVLTLSARRRRI
jgi:hypothetical protein